MSHTERRVASLWWSRLTQLVVVGLLALTTGCRDEVDVVQKARDEKRLMPGITYVRGGIVIDDPEIRPSPIRRTAPAPLPPVPLGVEGQRAWLHPVEWVPGQRFELLRGDKKTFMTVAPIAPWPYRVATFPLGGAGEAAASSEVPDAEVAFSPDGARLAYGAFGGQVRVVKVPTGELLFEKRFGEGLIRRLAFSPDGHTLYVGEQSPDGHLSAVDLATGELRWRLRSAEDVETSRPPPGDGRYGVYTLPGIYGLKVLPDGRIVASALHSWTTDRGARKHRSALYVLAPDGSRLWSLPERGALPLNLLRLDTDEAGRLLVVGTTSTQAVPSASPYQPGGVYAFDLMERKPLWSRRFEALTPHFKEVFFWESISVTPDGSRVVVGLNDGRAFVLGGADGAVLATHEHGVPVVMSGIPVASPLSYTAATSRGLYLQSNDSNLPSGTTDLTQTPPAPHPGAATLFGHDLSGALVWQHHEGSVGNGLVAAAQGRYLLTPVANRRADTRRDLHGFELFDLDQPGPLAYRPLFHYRTEGPTYFRAALSPDGLFAAVVETPAPLPDGTLYGTYQVHLVR